MNPRSTAYEQPVKLDRLQLILPGAGRWIQASWSANTSAVACDSVLKPIGVVGIRDLVLSVLMFLIYYSIGGKSKCTIRIPLPNSTDDTVEISKGTEIALISAPG